MTPTQTQGPKDLSHPSLVVQVINRELFETWSNPDKNQRPNGMLVPQEGGLACCATVPAPAKFIEKVKKS